MADMETIHIFYEDISPPDTWRLVEWCHHRGASEFSLGCVGIEGSIEQFTRTFDEMFSKYALGQAPREVLTSRTGADWIRPIALWQLNDDAIQLLRRILSGGIFMYELNGAWYEDLYLYRNTELMLGVVTHEQEGVMHITSEEKEMIDRMGIKYRCKAEWI